MNKIVEFPDRNSIERQAAAWLIRLDGDQPLSDSEQRELQDWMSRNSGNRQQLLRLAELWKQMNVLTELAVPLDAARSRTRWRFVPASMPLKIAAVAAMLLVGIAMSIFFLAGPGALDDTNGLYATAVGQQRSVPLQDGSVILLNTDSQVHVDYSDQYRDIVLLQGEAQFKVASNTSWPFRVSAGHGQIRAVGTAFSVYLRDDLVEVTVTEGTVALASVRSRTEPTGSGSALTGLPAPQTLIRELGTIGAGEVATIASHVNEQSETVDVLDNVSSIAEPALSRRLSWTEGVLYFSGEPLDEVVREISRYTTVNIEFADADVGAIRIGGRFPVGETDAMLETLQNTFGLHVDYLSDSHVLVSAGEQ